MSKLAELDEETIQDIAAGDYDQAIENVLLHSDKVKQALEDADEVLEKGG